MAPPLLGAVPTLDAIAADPSTVATLPSDAVKALLAKCAVAQGVLLGRLLEPERDVAEANTLAGDRLLSIQQTAERLGCSADHLYRHKSRFPFMVRQGRRVLFSEHGLGRYIERRMGR
jgi:hypothetical protein